MTTGLTAHTLAYNLNKIVYPWRESIASVLPIVDELIVCECFSTDGTYEDLLAIMAKEPKIRMIRRPWGTKCEMLGDLVNECVKEVRTPVHFQIQADEVLHEDSYPEFARLSVEFPGNAAMVHYTHFFNDFDTTYDFCYLTIPRVAKTNSGWKSTGDACALGGPPPVIDTKIHLYHYGKVTSGREVEAAVKEFEFQSMYKHHGFPDPMIIRAYEAGRFSMGRSHEAEGRPVKGKKPFVGTHPAVMTEFIKAGRERARNGR
jgi:glycosyltransferase involved in cell wall biosynthesis